MIKENEVLVYRQIPSYEYLKQNAENVQREYLDRILDVIKPGDKVVLKPNWVKESHMYRPGEWDYVITHPALIQIVLESVLHRLNGKGEVCIADAPQTDSDFEQIVKETGILKIIRQLQKSTKVKISCIDLREERWFYKEGIIVRRKKLFGDPKGYVKVNLKDKSEFYQKTCKNYYGADYDMEETRKYHNDRNNIYVMSATVLSADVFINLPKLKTHKLGGVTISAKNLVGTCVVKNSIPHHTLGSPETGGDKFMKQTSKNSSETALKGTALKLLKAKNPVINYPFILIKKAAGLFFGSPREDVVRNGAWYGNDTIWRSVIDLNKILLYADKQGRMHRTQQRKYISIVDGILGGEKKGPMEPDRKEAGVLIMGVNPIAADTAGTVLMGFDYRKVPSVINGYYSTGLPLAGFKPEQLKIISNEKSWEKGLDEFKRADTLAFEPHFGWKGHVELDE